MPEFGTLTVITALVIILSLVLVLLQARKKPPSLPLPPGPPVKNTQSGHLGDIEECGGLVPFLEKLHADYGPIATFNMGPNCLVSIASTDLFKHVSKDFDRPLWFMEPWAPLLGRNSVNLTNGVDAHHRIALYARCLSGPGLKQYFPTFNTLADEMAQTWLECSQKKQPIDLLPSTKTFAIWSLIKCCFGSYFDNPEKFSELQMQLDLSWDQFIKNLSRATGDGASKQVLEKAVEHLRNNMTESYKERQTRQYPEEEQLFIDQSLPNDDNDKKKIDDLLTLLVAGTHNTSNLLTWCFYFLAKYPDVQRKVYEEVMEVLGEYPVDENNFKNLSYTMQVWQENLRHRYLVIIPRVASSDMVLHGYQVASQTPMLHANFLVHHDPMLYHNPERFNPDNFSKDQTDRRPPFSFEPLGFAGNRRCVGYRFAEAEALTLIATIVRRFEVHLASEKDPVFRRDVVSIPEEPIKVVVTLRQ